ncbi:MAG TPA: NUDIX domain-containing protein [Chloroflexota bacterium]|jgi:8-oxo-dGTP pyrophosphatase MutT (NUDIX family)
MLAPTEIVLAVVRCGDQICLARRSQAVATSRGLWSVVTGYVEPRTDPLSQAWTELEEELGLCAPSIHLVRSLDPMPLTSPGSGKRFLVYPFLFDSALAQTLVINWEHDEAQWADPSRLGWADAVGWQLPLVRALLDEG